MEFRTNVLGGGAYKAVKNDSITPRNEQDSSKNEQDNYSFLQNDKNSKFYDTKLNKSQNYKTRKTNCKPRNLLICAFALFVCLFLIMANLGMQQNKSTNTVFAGSQDVVLTVPANFWSSMPSYIKLDLYGTEQQWWDLQLDKIEDSDSYSDSYGGDRGTGAKHPKNMNTAVFGTAIPDDKFQEGYRYVLTGYGTTTGLNVVGTTNNSVTGLPWNETFPLYFKIKNINELDPKITYLDQGGTAFSGTLATDSPTKYVEGTGATLLDPTPPTGYDFVDWYSDINCTGNPVTTISTSDTGDKTFYAKWKIKTITIALNGTLSGEGYMIYVYKGDAICKQVYITKGSGSFDLDWVDAYDNTYRLAFVFGNYGMLTFSDTNTTTGVNTNITTSGRNATITSFADTTITFTLANPRINSTIIV